MEIHDEDKVWVTITRTINLGNYENIKIEAGLSQTITVKTNRTKVLNACSDLVWDMVLDKSADYYEQLQPKKKKKKPKKYEDEDEVDNDPNYDN